MTPWVPSDPAVGDGARISKDLLTKTDTGIVARLEAMVDGARVVRLWGMSIAVPAHRMSKEWAWRVNTQVYEREEASAALEEFDHSLPLLELGGGFGAVACAINRRMENPHQHVVVEMDPEMCTFLRRNRMLNDAKYIVIDAAVTPGDAIYGYEYRDRFIGQRANPSGTGPVVTMTQAAEGLPRPFNVLMDVEGLEIELLCEQEFFTENVATIALEIHGHKARGACSIPTMMVMMGFDATWTRGSVWVFKNRRLPRH